MCHGFRDAANLAWQLQLVEQGGAPASLLATYQAERDPHVRQVIAAAIDAGRYICLLDPAAAARRDAQMRAQARSAAPTTAATAIRTTHVLISYPSSTRPFDASEGASGRVPATMGPWS